MNENGRRDFLRKTLLGAAAATVGLSSRPRPRPRSAEEEKLEELLSAYGSEIGSLRRIRPEERS